MAFHRSYKSFLTVQYIIFKIVLFFILRDLVYFYGFSVDFGVISGFFIRLEDVLTADFRCCVIFVFFHTVFHAP